MVRVGSLHAQMLLLKEIRENMTSKEQIDAVLKEVRKLCHMLSDNVKAREQAEDGNYERVPKGDTDLDSQEYFYESAYENARQIVKIQL